MTKEQWYFDHQQSDAPLQWTLADRGLKEATIFKDAQLSSTISDGFTLQQTQQDDSWETSLQNESWRSLHGFSVFMFYQFTTLTHRIIHLVLFFLYNDQPKWEKKIYKLVQKIYCIN